MKQPWDQRLSESDSEYRAFDRWLKTAPRPLPSESALAVRHGWAERASAFDLVMATPEDPGQCLAELVDTALRGGLIEARRWYLQVLQSNEPVDPKNFLKVIETVARVKEVADAGRRNEAPDYSDLTDDELWVIIEAAKLGQKKGLLP